MGKEKTKRKLILSLIKDDLINSKLVNGLGDIGINADDYLLHLSDTIFKLMEIPDTRSNEFIYENYLDIVKRSKYINITNGHDSLDNLVEEIYSYLLHEKSKLKN
jgi:hypothetical protein